VNYNEKAYFRKVKVGKICSVCNLTNLYVGFPVSFFFFTTISHYQRL